MERRIVALEGERKQSINEATVKSGPGTHRRHEGDRQARPLEQRSNQVWRLVVHSQVLHGALDSRHQLLFAEAEQSADPILDATRDPTEGTISGHFTAGCFLISFAKKAKLDPECPFFDKHLQKKKRKEKSVSIFIFFAM